MHGMVFISNDVMLQIISKQYNTITTSKLYWNTNMITKLSLVLPMDYYSGNKNFFYYQ